MVKWSSIQVELLIPQSPGKREDGKCIIINGDSMKKFCADFAYKLL
jgi:hypothetical protein